MSVKFNLTAGTRIGELNGIKWSDIDFEEKSILVQRQHVLVIEMDAEGEFHSAGKQDMDTLKAGEEPHKIPLTAEMEKYF